MKSNFGVFYKCYKETEAVNHSIDKLFSIYPECPVYLVSDGGNDFSYLEKKYPTLKASLKDDCRGWHLDRQGIPTIQERFTLPGTHENLYKTFWTVFQRVKDAVDFCDKEYMLFMEPDVLVRGEIVIPEGSSLLGVVPQPNISYDAGWINVLQSVPGAFITKGWSWPVIFSKEAFLEVYSFVKQNDDVLRRLLLCDYRFGTADDVWLPVLFGACGYGQEHSNLMTECNRNPSWRTSGHPLIHEYREMYPKPGSENVGRHSSIEHSKGN